MQGAARWSGTTSVQDQDFHAAVGAPPLRRCVRGDWKRVSRALGGNPVGRDLEVIDQNFLDPLGPALRQLLAARRVPPGVAMSNDENLSVVVHLDQFRDCG